MFKFDKNKLFMDEHVKLSRRLIKTEIFLLCFLIAVTQCYNEKNIN